MSHAIFTQKSFLIFSYLGLFLAGGSFIYGIYKSTWISNAKRLRSGVVLILCASGMSASMKLLETLEGGGLNQHYSSLWPAMFSAAIYISQFAFPFVIGAVGAGLVMNSLINGKPVAP